jgi:hypothetical protein
MDLVTKGVYVTNTYNGVQTKLDQLNTSEKQEEQQAHDEIF